VESRRSWAIADELVPWRGPLAEHAGGRARSLAARLPADGRIDAVSITDGAGGQAALSPEVFASELLSQGDQVIVHVACRDRNRNELLSLGWLYSTLNSGAIAEHMVSRRVPRDRTRDFPSLAQARGFRVPIRDVQLRAGAGFVTPLAGDMLTMPGLPAHPAGEKIDLDANGDPTGLF
jgi:hypothetical protein